MVELNCDAKKCFKAEIDYINRVELELVSVGNGLPLARCHVFDEVLNSVCNRTENVLMFFGAMASRL